MPSAGSLAAVPLLIALNAFFVAAEYALVAMRATQVELLRARGWRTIASAMTRLTANPASALGTVQICITMSNLMLGWIGEPAMSALLQWAFSPLVNAIPQGLFVAISTTLSFLIVTLATVVFSELLPKALTLKYAPTAAIITALPMLWLSRLFRPVLWIMRAMANLVTRPLGLGDVDSLERQRHSAEEIRLVAAEAAADGELSERERSLILNTLALGRRTAEQIMVPRVQVRYLDLERPFAENLEVLNEYLFSRMPLCRGGMDHVIGIVPTREVLTASAEAADNSLLLLLVRPAVFAPEEVSLETLLNLFHEHRTQMVLLADEHGGVEGLVTLRDVVDELLGPLGGVGPAMITSAGGSRLVVPGDLPLHELAARLGRETWASGESVVTAGGLVAARVGRIAQAGDRVDVDGVVLHVLEADERTVRRIEVLVQPPKGD